MDRNYTDMRSLIASEGGRFVRVDFFKKDNTLRRMVIQPAKLKYEIKGEDASDSARQGAATRAERYPNLLNVWDVEKEAIRSINLDTVVAIKANGRVYEYAS